LNIFANVGKNNKREPIEGAFFTFLSYFLPFLWDIAIMCPSFFVILPHSKMHIIYRDGWNNKCRLTQSGAKAASL
jgi:hypothetical protein